MSDMKGQLQTNHDSGLVHSVQCDLSGRKTKDCLSHCSSHFIGRAKCTCQFVRRLYKEMKATVTKPFKMNVYSASKSSTVHNC
jgi:hypothetical protein